MKEWRPHNLRLGAWCGTVCTLLNDLWREVGNSIQALRDSLIMTSGIPICRVCRSLSFPFQYFFSSTINRSSGHGALGTLNPRQTNKQTNVPKQTLLGSVQCERYIHYVRILKPLKLFQPHFAKTELLTPAIIVFVLLLGQVALIPVSNCAREKV